MVYPLLSLRFIHVDRMRMMRVRMYDFSWQRASLCWAYLQTTLRLDENTLRINGFCISLINRVLWYFIDSWLSYLTHFVDKSIDLSGQYACFSGATACRLSAKVKPLIRLWHAFDGKLPNFLAQSLPVYLLPAYWFFLDHKFWRAVFRGKFGKNSQRIIGACQTPVSLANSLSRIEYRHYWSMDGPPSSLQDYPRKRCAFSLMLLLIMLSLPLIYKFFWGNHDFIL